MKENMKELFMQNADRIYRAWELLLVAVIFFGLGMLFAERIVYTKSPIMVEAPEKGYALAVPIITSEAKKEEKTAPAPALAPAPKNTSIAASKGEYAASRYGKTYYRPSCTNRIKEENKIFFRTEEDAQKAGLILAKSCAQ